jgi:CMP-N-acetylneuraminic acid synthetase
MGMNLKNKKIIGEIPARYGSKRIPHKNLKLLNGKPLIQYSIDAAKKSKLLNDIYINTESYEIGQLAILNGIGFYKRNNSLSGDKIVSDQFNFDFIQNIKPDILVMINPVSPLITGKDIDNVIKFFIKNKYDTVITIKEEKLQSFYKDKPINFNPNKLLSQTQNIYPIQICTWSICVWDCPTFVNKYKQDGHAVFSGKVGFYPLNPLKAIKISTIDDFNLSEAILQYRKKQNEKI